MKRLADAISEEMARRKITSINDAAAKIGVTHGALRNVLRHGKLTNARTYKKYAKFLDKQIDEIREMAQLNPLASTSSRTLKSVADFGKRDLDDMVDAGVRSIQEAALTRVIGKIPLTLIETMRQMTEDEHASLLVAAREIISQRSESSDRIAVAEIERRVRRIKRHRLSTSRGRVARAG